MQRIVLKSSFEMFSTANGRDVFIYRGGYGDQIQTIPLGMTTDIAGFIYVGLYYGGAVLKINPK